MTHAPTGVIAFLDGWGCDPGLLDDEHRLVRIMETACIKAGAQVLNVLSRPYEPQGVGIVILLAESHASIHTYPEHGAYMADVFTCGDVLPGKATRHIHDSIGGEYRVEFKERGPNESS